MASSGRKPLSLRNADNLPRRAGGDGTKKKRRGRNTVVMMDVPTLVTELNNALEEHRVGLPPLVEDDLRRPTVSCSLLQDAQTL